jgi:hypothetical protein
MKRCEPWYWVGEKNRKNCQREEAIKSSKAGGVTAMKKTIRLISARLANHKEKKRYQGAKD